MAEDSDYLSLSKRFHSFAERASDPSLANAYRKLAQTYQALDYWQERFRRRYEEAAREVAAGQADADTVRPEGPTDDDR
jgi:hypothetical protein